MSRSRPVAGPPEPRPAARIANAADFAVAFAVSHETLARLATYERMLKAWQRAVNLVAPNSLDDVWHRHFADSAQLVSLAPNARVWLDLGAGAGFPGLVIAILLANRKDAMVRLVESNARKCAFMAEVARETGAPVEIRHVRIESLDAGALAPAPDIVTARALAPLSRLLELACPLLAPATGALFLKGRRVEDEIAAAREAWAFDLELHASITDPDGRIVELGGLRAKSAGDAA